MSAKLGRRQIELLHIIHDHGAAIEVIHTAEDERVFRSLERRGLVRWYRARRAASLHSNPFDATALTEAGEQALHELGRG